MRLERDPEIPGVGERAPFSLEDMPWSPPEANERKGDTDTFELTVKEQEAISRALVRRAHHAKDTGRPQPTREKYEYLAAKFGREALFRD